MEQIFQLALISVEGTVNAFNDGDDIWWLSCERRIFHCLLLDGELCVMAFGKRLSCSSNVIWWSFSIFDSIVPIDETFLLLTFYLFFRMWVSAGFGCRRDIRHQTTYSFVDEQRPSMSNAFSTILPSQWSYQWVTGAGKLMKMQL